MRTSRKVAIATISAATLIAVVSLGLGASATTHHAKSAGRLISAAAPTVAGHPGWQAPFVYNVPASIGGLFFHYACPAGRKAVNGSFVVGFADPSANSIHLIGNAPRTDVPPINGEWTWNINWFGAGSPSGSQITFNAYCK